MTTRAMYLQRKLSEYWAGAERFVTKYPKYFSLASIKNSAHENIVRKKVTTREVEFKSYV